MKPKVTFTLPTNRIEFIDKAVDSILNQTLEDFELIIIDGLKDRELKFNDSRVRIYKIAETNISKSRNMARQLARSNYILPASDDDIWFRERAAITYDYLTHGVDFFYGSFLWMDINGRVMTYCPVSQMDFKWLQTVNSPVCILFSGYRLDKTPSYREKFPTLNDYVFLYECCKKGVKFQHSKIPLGMLRQWTNTKTLTTKAKKAEETLLLRKVFNDPLIRSKRSENMNFKYAVPVR